MICSSPRMEGEPLPPARPQWLFPAKEPQPGRWDMLRPWHWPPLPRHLHWGLVRPRIFGIMVVLCITVLSQLKLGKMCITASCKAGEEQLEFWVFYFMSEYSMQPCKFLQGVYGRLAQSTQLVFSLLWLTWCWLLSRDLTGMITCGTSLPEADPDVAMAKRRLSLL